MKRIFNWGAFIVIIGLIVWGLVAAQMKAAREEQAVLLPTDIATSTDHIHGNVNAPVTLVEYGDFQCPACGAYYPIVEQIVASTSPDTLRFVFRHFPLTQHANAIPAAKASEAASLQGKFWDMYNKLYSTQKDWENSTDTKTVFVGYAKSLGLDEKKFLSDFESKSIQEVINNQYKGGAKAGINSTPTFFLNGAKIANPQSYDEFKKLIDNAGTPATPAVPKLTL